MGSLIMLPFIPVIFTEVHNNGFDFLGREHQILRYRGMGVGSTPMYRDGSIEEITYDLHGNKVISAEVKFRLDLREDGVRVDRTNPSNLNYIHQEMIVTKTNSEDYDYRGNVLHETITTYSLNEEFANKAVVVNESGVPLNINLLRDEDGKILIDTEGELASSEGEVIFIAAKSNINENTYDRRGNVIESYTRDFVYENGRRLEAGATLAKNKYDILNRVTY